MEGPPATWGPACLTCTGQGTQAHSFLNKYLLRSSPRVPHRTVLFSTPTNPLIEDKASANPRLIKAATKLAKMCPRLRRTKQTRGWGLHGETSSPFSLRAQERCGGDSGRDSGFLAGAAGWAGGALPWGAREGGGQGRERNPGGVPTPT